jgi:ribose/xylose/arabinose/galactoside ABC-type transport system permease subunit
VSAVAATSIKQPQPHDLRSTSRLRRVARRREGPLVLVTLAIFGITSALQPHFALGGNISFMLAGAMPLAIVAVGQTIVCLVRGIDLSVAPVLGIGAVSTGFLAQDHATSLWLLLLLAIGIGIGLGFVNGLFVTYARIPPIITTLGTFTVYGGVQQLICNTRTVVTPLPIHTFATLGSGDFLPDVPWLLIPGVLVTVALAVVLWRTKWGRSLYAFGNNADAAFRAGIRTSFVQISAYTACGMLASVGGLVYLLKFGSAGYTTGSDVSIQLQSIACVLIGGSTLTGGKGGVVGSFLAAIFLTVTLEAVIVAGIAYDWQSAAVGFLLLGAILVDAYQNRRGGSMRGSLRTMLSGRGRTPTQNGATA